MLNYNLVNYNRHSPAGAKNKSRYLKFTILLSFLCFPLNSVFKKINLPCSYILPLILTCLVSFKWLSYNWGIIEAIESRSLPDNWTISLNKKHAQTPWSIGNFSETRGRYIKQGVKSPEGKYVDDTPH